MVGYTLYNIIIIMETSIYTDNIGSRTEIFWYDLMFQKLDSCDHSVFYECRGYDILGRQYSGSVEYCCCEHEEITGIERITWMHRNKKPYKARILLKSIKYWQSVIDGVSSPKRSLAYYKNKLGHYTKSDIDWLEKVSKRNDN